MCQLGHNVFFLFSKRKMLTQIFFEFFNALLRDLMQFNSRKTSNSIAKLNEMIILHDMLMRFIACFTSIFTGMIDLKSDIWLDKDLNGVDINLLESFIFYAEFFKGSFKQLNIVDSVAGDSLAFNGVIFEVLGELHHDGIFGDNFGEFDKQSEDELEETEFEAHFLLVDGDVTKELLNFWENEVEFVDDLLSVDFLVVLFIKETIFGDEQGQSVADLRKPDHILATDEIVEILLDSVENCLENFKISEMVCIRKLT